jgi:hypothetical protein
MPIFRTAQTSNFTIANGSLAASPIGFKAKDAPLFCTVKTFARFRKIGQITSKYRVRLNLVSRLLNRDYMENAMSKRLLTEADTSKVVGLAVSTLRNDRSLGRTKIAYVKLGRLVRYRLSDIESYLENLPRISA